MVDEVNCDFVDKQNLDTEQARLAKWANLTSLVQSINFTAEQLHFRVSENFAHLYICANDVDFSKSFAFPHVKYHISLINLIFQSQIIGNHCDKFAIGGLSAVCLNGVAEIGI